MELLTSPPVVQIPAGACGPAGTLGDLGGGEGQGGRLLRLDRHLGPGRAGRGPVTTFFGLGLQRMVMCAVAGVFGLLAGVLGVGDFGVALGVDVLRPGADALAAGVMYG